MTFYLHDFSRSVAKAVAVLFLLLPAVLAAATCPAPASNAFTGCYYNDMDLSGDPVLVRTDPVINFYWGNSSPAPSLTPLDFSVSWAGNFSFTAGNYTFKVITSDGMRLYVDGNLIINRWRDQSAYQYQASQTLTQGTHLIVVQYYEHLGGATAQVSWVNNSPSTQGPTISSFTATPASVAAGSAAALAWSVSGATSLSIDNGIGNVTGETGITVYPAQTTTYTLTATSANGTSSQAVTVTTTGAGASGPPGAPILTSAVAVSPTEADLAWTAAAGNPSIAGYQITRNGFVAGSAGPTTLTWADTSVAAGATYVYSVKAYDASGNYSAASNSIQVTMPILPVAPGACPGPATNAFTGCYYSNMTLSGNPSFVRTDSQINFSWGNQSPSPLLTPDDFSASWAGNFTFSQGNYTFHAITSDGMRVYIDGNLIINSWKDQPPYMYTAQQTVSQGSHLILVQYYEHLGGATAQVSWAVSSPSSLPVISSFTATPSSTAAGKAVTLAWSVSGATSVTIDNSVGDVTTKSSVNVLPSVTTTYTLTAQNAAGSSTDVVTVTVLAGADTQPPTIPTLISALAPASGGVNLTWTAATDNVGVAGYQILRNGAAIASVPETALTYLDSTAAGQTTYTYAVKAYDAAGNYSAAGNSIQVNTPAASPLSVTWYGGCWEPATLYGITANYQAIDFQLTTPAPMPVQGTLFYGPSCDESYGTDNMNDFGTLTGSTHMIQGFSHNPNVMPTSAVYWIGSPSATGMCPAGAPCSGCVHYNQATPQCSALP